VASAAAEGVAVLVSVAPTLAELAVPIDSLRLYKRNPRRGNLEAIKRSLEAHGQYRPIVARKGTGEVLAGNHTLQAARELGWESIAATFVEVDDEQAARIVLVDNRSSDLGTYDDGELAALLESLPGLEGTGWDERSFDRLLGDLERGSDGDRDTEPAPLPTKATTKPGELWQLGDHRLACGDAIDPAVVRAVLGGAEPHLLVTDPPYGVELEMEWRDDYINTMGPAEASYMRTGTPGYENTSMSGDTRADWSEAYELVPSLKVAYVWHASRHSHEVHAGLERIGLEVRQQIIWAKTIFIISRQHYQWQHEPCWYAFRTGAKVRWLGGHAQGTVWTMASPKMIMAGSKEERVDHPTQKPVELYRRPIANHLRKGEALYDPFVGSGTALIAAENLGRVCYAVEIDPRYVDVIIDRWQRHVGGKAKRVGRA
jgi:DNA modification methylase